jgi:hypothetical protein
MRRFALFVVLIAIAVGIGMWLGGRSRAPSAYEQARSSLEIEMARAMLPYRVAFRVLLGAVVLGILGGVGFWGGGGWGIVRWLHRRATTVYADRAGLYPIREERVGRARIFHDPNRTLTGTTVYRATGGMLDVRQPLPDGQGYAQQQVTAQAQAAQALRAAASGHSPLGRGASSLVDIGARQTISQPLPEVQELDMEPSHIQRLLLEDGAHDG